MQSTTNRGRNLKPKYSGLERTGGRSCRELEKDIWGQAYKIVMKKIGHGPQKIPPDIRREQIHKLFPENEKIEWNQRNIMVSEISEINNNDLLNAVRILSTNKAPGPDFIPPKVVREVVMEIPDTVSRIMNKNLKEGTFPSSWKEARVVLLENAKNNVGDATSYRPICLLNTLGRLFEIVLNERLKKELEEKDLLSERQFGFRKGRCTVDAIRMVTDVARNELNKQGDCTTRRMCTLTTLDIRNAFNSP
jgi:Reverse transcriptase (RNA-dependent DNA polymerase).